MFILIKDSRQIRDLNNLASQLKNDTLFLKEQIKQLEKFNNRINETEKKLLEKETEINNLKLIIYNLSDQMKNTEKNSK